MAFDTWTDNEGSQRAHAALGYEEVDRCVNFRKRGWTSGLREDRLLARAALKGAATSS